MTLVEGVQFRSGSAFILGDSVDAQLQFLLHLTTDSTPAPVTAVWPSGFHELSGGGYAPAVLDPGGWTADQTATGIALDTGSVSFTLDPSAAGETVYGWVITAKRSPTSFVAAWWGGLLPSPFVVPPAGGVLVIDNVRVFQNDCAAAPPPPAPPPPYVRDFFHGPALQALPAHTMDAGLGWRTLTGGPDLVLTTDTCVASLAASCGDTTDTLAADYIIRVGYTHQADSFPLLIFRSVDDDNLWYLFFNGTDWQLTEVVAAVQTGVTTGADTIPAGQQHEFTVVVTGSTVTLLHDGVPKVTYSGMSTNLTGSRVGLLIGATGAAVPTASYDHFGVDPLLPLE